MQVSEPSIGLIRGRTLISILFISLILTALIVATIWPDWLDDKPPPLPDALLGLIWYSSLALIIYGIGRRARVTVKSVLGPVQSIHVRKYLLTTLPLVAISIGSVYLLYLPLSYLIPDFVQWWLLQDDGTLVWMSGQWHGVANIVNFAVAVVIAPIIEEILFRGFLLNRWAYKWSVPTAILVSSLFFGLLHADIIGGVFFSYVMCVFYIRTRSLLIPIIIHMANNGLMWIFMLADTLIYGSDYEYSIVDFQSDWWFGALGIAIGLPWAIWFVRHNWPSKTWQAPMELQVDSIA